MMKPLLPKATSTYFGIGLACLESVSVNGTGRVFKSGTGTAYNDFKLNIAPFNLFEDCSGPN